MLRAVTSRTGSSLTLLRAGAVGGRRSVSDLPASFFDDSDAHLTSKSLDSGVVASVFGSTGFAGRYVVNRLAQLGSQVILPYRGEEKAYRHMKLMGDLGQIVPFECDLTDVSQIEEACSRSDVVVNLVGRKWDTRNYSLDETNHQIPKRIAQVAKDCGVGRFVHVGALESDLKGNTEYARTKAKGEQAVREVFPEAVILRPSSLFGFEDRLLNRWAGVVRYWPVTPELQGQMERKEGPLCVSDLAKSVQSALADPLAEGQTFDLQGPLLTRNELLAAVEEALMIKKTHVPVNAKTAGLVSQALGVLRNPRFTPEEIKLMCKDNVASGENKLIEDLGVEPDDIRHGIIKYIRHYRMPNFINIIEY